VTKLQPVRGTKDFIGEEILLYNHVVDSTRKLVRGYGYQEVATPIFEFSELFKRSLGDSSDVITKEMYSFLDKGGKEITLRPEFTAGVMRAMISNGWRQNLPLKLFSYGPLFRYERPQKGRFRQFHQINAELLGIKSPIADAEVIMMASHLLENLGLADDVVLNLNSLGDQESRDNYRKALIEYLTGFVEELSEDSKTRLYKNPLRVLDSKEEQDQAICNHAPRIIDYLNNESKDFFESLCEILDDFSINYVINHKLVRGLDYYSHSCFEFVTEKLGAQGTVLGGGRYDGLAETLGTSSTPAVGFGGGIERLMMLISYKPEESNIIAIIPVGKETYLGAHKIAYQLRKEGLNVHCDFEGNVAKRLKKADKIGAKIALFIGEEEILQNKFKLRYLDTGQEELVEVDKLLDYLMK